ncbi:MAG: DEAD/DEAH box helicase, partial [Polyangiaceae bacterium]|nr:DEAD/DEAH box helicase [Polyangiaceae bacterium]
MLRAVSRRGLISGTTGRAPGGAPSAPDHDPLAAFQEPVRRWFRSALGEPTAAQRKGWPPILAGRSTLLLAPTGSGKTLAAFLAAIDGLMFGAEPARRERCRVLYVSPLKALAVDVERNLRAPIEGVAAAAEQSGAVYRRPTVAVRSGDTPAAERARIGRAPPDVLITTPESLYLLLTSSAREILATVETVIVDEIHALAPTKRGAHLFLSLERLEALRSTPAAPLQRIGLSATQRPLDELARLLGGGEPEARAGDRGAGRRTATAMRPRPVEIVDAGARKEWELRVEVPVDDMTRPVAPPDEASKAPPRKGRGGDRARGRAGRPGAGERGAARPPEGPERPQGGPSIWPSIYPRLVELVRAHRSTMIFANSRRLSERLAAAINEAAGEEIALAHHGSVSREARQAIEERLKAGELPAIVATSTLELGLDGGAVDLVIQIEAPPSVAAGLQRIGRAGHSVGAVSRGVIFPKYRGDLLACAAATARMRAGQVEETRYPRNPLDVLAQQVVAIAAMDRVGVEDLYALVRRAAPFADLPRASFEGVLDMLSGRYPSDEFADLRPRITWDRGSGVIRARDGAKRLAVTSGGTIPDRGLYGVFLVDAEAEGRSRRVGELDEEMVFESRVGDVFVLGASSWRIEEIQHDRVLVRPAPGEPGKMPFWHGDRPGRPLELGRAIGELSRRIAGAPPDEARRVLEEEHLLDARAAGNLIAYVRDQAQATGEVPSDRAIVVERSIDEMGDPRVCLLSPLGARVHAPWAIAVEAALRDAGAGEVDLVWSDDGIVFRLPGAEAAPPVERFLPGPDEVEDLVVRSLGQTSLFASRFREGAGRALLLPRRRPGQRSPLWATRRRAADLLAVASRYGSFPLILEAYRECLRDVFDLPGLVEVLRQIQARKIRVLPVDARAPSPFAASLLFSYVASFMYEGDAPLAERRAQALSLDTAELRELLGEADLRELLDPDAIAALERALQRLDGRRPITSADALHDLLLSIGDLREDEIAARAEDPSRAAAWIEELARGKRAIRVTIAGEPRIAAVEDAGRLRDALGIELPAGLPAALLEPVEDPLGDLVSRYARTHGPFLAESVAARLGLGVAAVRSALDRLVAAGRVVEAELTEASRPSGGRGAARREHCDAEVLRTIKRRSLAKLRKEVEPAPAEALARFLPAWQGAGAPRAAGAAGPGEPLLAVIEQLQGAPLVASALEADVLPARVRGFRASDLDLLCATGEVAWVGLEPLGPGDGRVALFLAPDLPLLAPAPREVPGELAARVRDLLARRGALFVADLVAELGGFPADLLGALWSLVWAGHATNDTLAPLRSLAQRAPAGGRRAERARAGVTSGAPGRAPHVGAPGARSPASPWSLHRGLGARRAGPPGSEGRWSLL